MKEENRAMVEAALIDEAKAVLIQIEGYNDKVTSALTKAKEDYYKKKIEKTQKVLRSTLATLQWVQSKKVEPNEEPIKSEEAVS